MNDPFSDYFVTSFVTSWCKVCCSENHFGENELSKKIDLAGDCLCGAVKVSLSGIEPKVGACHCQMCQQWCGGPGMAIDVGENIAIVGKKSLKIFASSEWGERAFCAECGSSIYYRLKDANQHFVYAGLFAKSDELILDHQIYIDHKPAYYTFAEKTPTMTEAEVVAMFAAN